MGAELESRCRLSDDLLLVGNCAWHDARFGDTLTQLDGAGANLQPATGPARSCRLE